MAPFSRLLLQSAELRLAALPRSCVLHLPGGETLGPTSADLKLVIRDMRALAHLARGAIGQLAQDYVEGRIDIRGRLRDVMAVAPALLGMNPTKEAGGFLQRLRRTAWEKICHTPARDAEQVRQHYDLSDEFFALWLDPRRVYSCAYFETPGMSLASAQEAKLDLICRKLLLRSGERFIDIGAGWGALLLWAAEHYGVDATGITLSKHQHAYANQRIQDLGLGTRVRMLLQDYRDVDETRPFDKVASIGMCEHVGRRRLPGYFAKIRRLLKPGGLVLNHGITTAGTDNAQLDAGMGDFIEKYIFPGGQLVHVGAMLEALARGGLEPLDAECLRPHYAQTLWHWSESLEAENDSARRILGPRGDKILRAYRLYLAGSAMSFEQGWLSLFQILGAHLDGLIEPDAQLPPTMRARQCAYPFERGYMQAPQSFRPCASKHRRPNVPLLLTESLSPREVEIGTAAARRGPGETRS